PWVSWVSCGAAKVGRKRARSRNSEEETSRDCPYLPYVLITPAGNEEAFIEKTIRSVIGQTVLPAKWVIVDDGSTDSTASIVERYLARYEWIEMIQMPRHRDRSFAAKVYSFNAGYQRVTSLPYEIIGQLDTDVSFDEVDCEI